MLLTLVAIAAAFSITSTARAQETAIEGLNVGQVVERSVQGRPGTPGDFNQYLADELGISVEELQAAQERAHMKALEQAVEDGLISEEALEMMKAKQAFRAYIDPQEMLAQALGVDVDQLETYREEGKSMSEILDELGLTPSEVREAQQAAFESALQDAVTDGAITQEQADLIQNSHFEADRGSFFGHGRHDRMKPPGGPWDGMPDGSRSETPSEDTGTSL